MKRMLNYESPEIAIAFAESLDILTLSNAGRSNGPFVSWDNKIEIEEL